MPDATGPAPGELRERAIFQRRATAGNTGGVVRSSWTTLIRRRSASLLPQRTGGGSSEIVTAARVQGLGLWDLWVRYDSETSTVTCDDRVVDGRDPTRTFNIKSGPLDLSGRRRWVLFVLEQGKADG